MTPPRVDTLPVLSAAECAAWTGRVLALRRHWTPRHPHLPFFTLGMAAYLDAVRGDPQLGGRRPYEVDALRSLNNDLIATEFQPLLDACCAALARHTGRPARCLGGPAALPGFHIHLPHPMFSQDVASRHVDLQFRQVFAGREVQPEELLTVTLPLSLPAGAGLRLWDGEAARFHPYALGHLALHDGLAPHQAVLHPQGGPVPRVMLQCHALLRDGAWDLYW